MPLDPKHIKALRKHLDLSQQAVADRMGVRQQVYARYESETKPINPRLDHVEKLAAALEVSISRLLTAPASSKSSRRR